MSGRPLSQQLRTARHRRIYPKETTMQPHDTDRLARNIVQQALARSDSPEREAVIDMIRESELDIQDCATALRIAAGEATDLPSTAFRPRPAISAVDVIAETLRTHIPSDALAHNDGPTQIARHILADLGAHHWAVS